MVIRRSLVILIAILLPATALAATKYVVQKGDNLYDLSRKFGVSVEDLKKSNHLTSNRLDIGNVLEIPEAKGPGSKTTNTGSISNNNEYVVKKGDTLGHIAVKFSTTSREIKKLNGLKSDSLQIGQVLKIKSLAKEGKPAQSNESTAKSGTPETNAPNGRYTVRKGDTPGEIAEKLGVSTRELIKLNGIESRNLRIGQVLRVPGLSPEDKKIPDPGVASGKPSTKDKKQSEPTERSVETRSVPAVYTVRKGDTPGEIAEKLGVSTKELIKLNNLDGKVLQIGQKLAVPGAVSRDVTPESALADREDQKTKTDEGKSAKTPKIPVSSIPAEYTVKRGDNLHDLSRKFGVSVNEIKNRNNLKTNNIRIGQKLILNTSGTARTVTAGAEEKVETVSNSQLTDKYTVKKGDTLGHLAIKFGISQRELKNLNGLQNSTLRIGQVLRVPGSEEKIAIVVREKDPSQVSDIYIKKRYVVKSGDTLSGIASGFGVTVSELKKTSALKNDTINAGDVLLIPVPQEKVTTSKYTVAAGDTLGKIGSRFGVSVKELKSANGLTSDKVWVGMKLNIPGIYSTDSGGAATNTVIAKTPAVKSEYVVKRGDTLGAIAKRHGVSVKELKRENNIKGNIIRVNQVLYIPGHNKQATKYVAVSEKALNNTNGHHKVDDSGVKNGRFSKESIIQVAKKYLGAPYKFGGYDFTTGIDCSGYVKKIFSRFNVELPRTARDIYYRAGARVERSQLDSGDLVFFQTYAKYPSHVGIYLGNEEFIHASSASKMVTIDNINKRYYRSRYIGAKRVQLSGLFYDELTEDYRGFENSKN
ncbi:MAG: LysM peptidoglycan-binding domain-containing protein [Deltaproteobacteria bacterium]